MRGYASHEHAALRLQERFKQHQRFELEDLLRYLEDVSSEPAGKEGYGLALCLRTMSLPADNSFTLLRHVKERLSDFHRIGVAHESIRDHLDGVARFLDSKFRHKEEGSSHFEAADKKENETETKPQPPSSGPNRNEDPEFTAACSQGYEISRSIRIFHKWHLFHNMAALALYWTCFKPSSHPSEESIPWIEEDVIRMFR
jgi:hypothetical protein